MKQFRVSKTTDPKQLAGAINSYFDKSDKCELTAIGSNSIAIATKALALLTCMFKREYASVVNYKHINKGSEDISAILFTVERK